MRGSDAFIPPPPATQLPLVRDSPLSATSLRNVRLRDRFATTEVVRVAPPNIQSPLSLLDRAVLDLRLRVPEDRNRSLEQRQSTINIRWRYSHYFCHTGLIFKVGQYEYVV
eukprot:564025-Prorocentrum_minimum.AAC.1